MITEDYVSFEIAVLLKEKGFDERGLCVYAVEEEHLYLFGDWVENSCLLPHLISAPTLQMAMKWLKKEKHFYPDIATEVYDTNVKYRTQGIYSKNDCKWHEYEQLFDSYEEAVEAVLKYSLENLI